MVEFSKKNKWMYLSFALIGVIGIGVLTPQANAATKDIHQQIIDAINGINAKVTDLKGESISLRIDGKAVSTGPYTILPAQEGKVYVGHLSVVQGGSSGVSLYWQCSNEGTTVLGVTNIVDQSSLNTDFSCEQMKIYADVENEPRNMQLFGSVSYVQYDATEVTDIS
jgi:hypothetical protein